MKILECCQQYLNVTCHIHTACRRCLLKTFSSKNWHHDNLFLNYKIMHTMYPYLHPYTGCPRKKLCSRGITYWGNNFRLIFTIKVSVESSMNLFIKSKLLWLIWTPGKLVEMDSPCGFTPILVPMTVWVLHAVFRIHIILIWIRIRGSVSVIMDPDPDPDTDPDPDPR